ncbi:MAG: hypothetical protein KKB31_04245 [Nanoarchaeota archaeon]|nr:hypothetical protein [Nanoarchaeota archaeon]
MNKKSAIELSINVILTAIVVIVIIGILLTNLASNKPSICIEEDEGIEFEQTYFFAASIIKGADERYDNCLNEDILQEYFCKDNKIESVDIMCASYKDSTGQIYKCQDGRCIIND